MTNTTEIESINADRREVSAEAHEAHIGEQIITNSFQVIHDTEQKISDMSDTPLDPVDLVKKTGVVLAREAGFEMESDEYTDEQRIDAVTVLLVETADEESYGATGKQTAIVNFDVAQYPDVVNKSIHRLEDSHAQLRNGVDAAPQAMKAIHEAFSSNDIMQEPGQIEYVETPPATPELSDTEKALQKDVDVTMRSVENFASNMYITGGELDGAMLRKIHEGISTLDWQNVSTKQGNDIVASFAMFDQTYSNVRENSGETGYLGRDMTMALITDIMPAEVTQKLYHETGEDGNDSMLKTYMRNKYARPEDYEELYSIASAIYGDHEGGVEGVEAGQDEVVDTLRALGQETETILFRMPEKPEKPYEIESVAEHADTLRLQTKAIFNDKLHLSEGVVSSLGLGMWSRVHSKGMLGEPTYVDGEKLKTRLQRVVENVNAVGTSLVERLHNEVGVVNIDNYAPEDLENLNKLLDKDEEYVEHLKAGDVTVVFNDTYGDHNGALSTAFDAYRKESGRTLMFEVSSPGDIYRRMIMLQKLGVKPSSLVLSAHGSPGITHFGTADKGFQLVSAKYLPSDATERVSLADASIDRLIGDDFMQPNRGVDSTSEQVGRREVILNSCSSDVEFFKGIPSSSEVVARAGNRPDTDVYGASDVMYLDERKDGAVRFAGLSDEKKVISEPTFDDMRDIGTKITVDGPLNLADKAKKMFTDNGRAKVAGVPDQLMDNLKIKRTRVTHINIYDTQVKGVA